MLKSFSLVGAAIAVAGVTLMGLAGGLGVMELWNSTAPFAAKLVATGALTFVVGVVIAAIFE